MSFLEVEERVFPAVAMKTATFPFQVSSPIKKKIIMCGFMHSRTIVEHRIVHILLLSYYLQTELHQEQSVVPGEEYMSKLGMQKQQHQEAN